MFSRIFPEVHFAILHDDQIRIINRNNVAVCWRWAKECIYSSNTILCAFSKIILRLCITTSFTIRVRFEGETVVLVVYFCLKTIYAINNRDFYYLQIAFVVNLAIRSCRYNTINSIPPKIPRKRNETRNYREIRRTSSCSVERATEIHTVIRVFR